MCGNKMLCGGILLIVGILYLLKDYGVALTWWKLEWSTALFLIAGICMLLKKKKE